MPDIAASYDWGYFVNEGYPMVGEPGSIRFYDPQVERGFFVSIHALLDYDERGYLQGALMYFPYGSPVDQPGNVSIIVRPNSRRKGVATRLVRTALEIGMPLDPTIQDYTPEGRALLLSLSTPIEEADND